MLFRPCSLTCSNAQPTWRVQERYPTGVPSQHPNHPDMWRTPSSSPGSNIPKLESCKFILSQIRSSLCCCIWITICRREIMEQKEGVASAVNSGEEPSRNPDPNGSREERDLEAPLMPAEAGTQPAGQQKDTLLYICAVLSIVTAVGGLLCMVVNLISLLRSIDYRGFDYRVSVFVGVVRFFAVAFALVVVVAETEWVPILRFWKVLDYWVGRGLLQVFVASLTYVLARASGETRAEGLLHEVASWWLLLCGIVYIVAGLLCLGTVKRNRLHKGDWREQAQKDLEEVHRRRDELEAQLHGRR